MVSVWVQRMWKSGHADITTPVSIPPHWWWRHPRKSQEDFCLYIRPSEEKHHILVWQIQCQYQETLHSFSLQTPASVSQHQEKVFISLHSFWLQTPASIPQYQEQVCTIPIKKAKILDESEDEETDTSTTTVESDYSFMITPLRTTLQQRMKTWRSYRRPRGTGRSTTAWQPSETRPRGAIS